MKAENESTSVSRRIIAMLRLFAEGGDTFSVHEIAERLDLAPSSVHRLLAGLVDENIVERAAKRRYCVGREFGRIGALVARKIDVRRLARPMLQTILAVTGETAMLGIMLPRSSELMVADKIESIHVLRYRIALHARRSLLWGATGRAVLAWLDPEEIGKVLASATNAPGSGDPPPTPAALANALGDIRKAGYAISRGQIIPGAVGLAAPIFDADDRVIGDLAVTIPEIRFRRRDEQRLARLVTGEARKLSMAMGSRGRPGETSSARRPQ